MFNRSQDQGEAPLSQCAAGSPWVCKVPGAGNQSTPPSSTCKTMPQARCWQWHNWHLILSPTIMSPAMHILESGIRAHHAINWMSANPLRGDYHLSSSLGREEWHRVVLLSVFFTGNSKYSSKYKIKENNWTGYFNVYYKNKAVFLLHF